MRIKIKTEHDYNISMNTIKNKTIANAFITINMPAIIKNIKTGISYMYLENIFVDNQKISAQDLRRLSDEEFRYQVKTAIDDFVYFQGNIECTELKRYINRMSTNQMKRKFNYNEVNKFYIEELIKFLRGEI